MRQHHPDKSNRKLAAANPPAASVSPPRTVLSRGRYWCFALLASVGLPLLLLSLVEFCLRLTGYGHDTSFFKRIRVGAESYYVENDRFGLSFFRPELARSPAPIRMQANKPADTIRIFLLGESAALGDPRPAYGPGRYLQALLEDRYPSHRFEVVCVAMTAINSHAILPIARECAEHEPDAWILYMGNNEMVGPFGATSVFGTQTPPRTLVRLNLACQRLRLGQLLVALLRRCHSPPRETTWGGMKMFLASRVPPHDPRKEAVYRNFRANLESIVTTLCRSGAPGVVNTVAVNLSQCPPFAWQTATNRSVADQTTFEQPTQAAVAFDRALQLDPDNALLEFQLGTSLLVATNKSRAREHFQKACDSDTLPFRADSSINALIRQAAKQADSNVVAFCDAAELFATNSPLGSPGQEAFWEHVHFNFDANYALARVWAAELGPLIRGFPKETSRPWATQETCEIRLGLTDWNRAAVLDDLIRRLGQPPFTNQLHQADRLEAYRDQWRKTQQRLTPDAAQRAREVYRHALQVASTDFRLHENYAEFLEAVADLPAAVSEWQQVGELIPQHHLAFFQKGRLLARQGKLDESQTALVHAVTLRPDLAEGWLELGKLHATQGQFEQALADFERERQLLPQDSRLYYEMGRALSKLGRRAEAIRRLERALELRPEYWEARYALGEELAFDRKVVQAQQQFEQVIRLRPEYPMAHLNLGVALVQQGRLEEAARQFEETQRLEPMNRLARDYLDQVRRLKQGNSRATGN